MATYFVSQEPGASDSNSGLTELLPWLTVNKVNISSFSGNDVVQLNSNYLWREQCTFPSSGTAGNRITIRAYGTGTPPILSGYDAMTGFTDGGSNIWDNTGVTTQPLGVLVNSAFRKKMAASRAACTAAGDWFWTANTLSVYATSDPSGNVEAGQRIWAFHTNNKNFLHITGLTFTGGNGGGGMVVTGAPSDVLIDYITLDLNPGVGIQLNAGTTGVTLDHCVISDNGAPGVSALDGPAATNFFLTYNTIIDNGWRNLSAGNCSGMVCWVMSGEIAYNTFDGNGAEATTETGTEHGIYQGTVDGSTAVAHHNICIGQTKGFGIKWQGDGMVRDNWLDGNRAGIMVGANGTSNAEVTVLRNMILNTWGAAIYEQSKGAGTLEVRIYHNTIYNCETQNQGNGGGLNIVDDLTVLDVRNNIFSICSSGRIIWFVVAQTGIVTYNHNLTYQPSDATPWRIGAVEMNFATWQSNGYDVNGLNTDPLFINAAGGDLHLKAESPCIGMGTLIKGINY